MVHINLKPYLEELQVRQAGKSAEQRRSVPTLSEISKDAQIHYTTLSRMANYHTKRLDFKTAEKIIRAVRGRGFDMQMSDLITFREKAVN
jgi:hypothetical protein